MTTNNPQRQFTSLPRNRSPLATTSEVTSVDGKWTDAPQQKKQAKRVFWSTMTSQQPPEIKEERISVNPMDFDAFGKLSQPYPMNLYLATVTAKK
jgi:hypothetical protein